jgi:DNA-binding transcriptional ArsR family regulator
LPGAAVSLARARFAIAPLFEAVAVLGMLARTGASTGNSPWIAGAVRAISTHRLDVLSGFTALPAGSYLPDFLTPEPAAFDGDLTADLHRVAGTPVTRIRAELSAVLDGRPRAGLRPAPVPRRVLDALERGERAFANRVADELDVLWREALRPGWPGARRTIEDDVEARARMISRFGMAATVSSLSPQLSWHNDDLFLASRYTVDVTWGRTVIFVPSRVARAPVAFVDPCRQRTTVLMYPARAGERDSAEPATEPLADVFGRTRTALLAKLDRPRTNGELSASSALAESTVSYHLRLMHRAGLVSRSRRGRFVYYQRLPRGTALLDGHPEHPGPPG